MAGRGLTGASAAWFLPALFGCLAAVLPAEEIPRFRFGARTDYSVPVAGDERFFDPGYAVGAVAEYALSPRFSLLARVSSSTLSVKEFDPILALVGAAGLSWNVDLSERAFFGAEASCGLFRAFWGDLASSGPTVGARVEAGLRLSPAIRLSAGVGADRLFRQTGALYTGLSAGLSLSLTPAGLDSASSRLKTRTETLSPVYPVFYSFYDDHPFGSVELINGEDSAIRDVRVSFFASEYMSRPTECAAFSRLEKGATARVPITALFDEKILSLTERTASKAELRIGYRLLGAEREYRRDLDLSVLNRNAMSWTDDRRAAAFVSAKDPAVLWFSRFVNAVVRDRFRSGIDRNLQQAAGVFEALKLYGLAYVVDPSSAYVDSVGNEGVVDYLQFPHQTLFYRGGDCDDLSILYASLLQSLGIETAFITIPGHIFLAFSTAADVAASRKLFRDPGLLIVRDDRAWLPVEVTMIKDGFVKAWRVGAKEWADNSAQGTASFYPLKGCWADYPPVGIADVNPRFMLPDEAQTKESFDLALDRYVAREIEPTVLALKNSAKGTAETVDVENELGIVYAGYGMLDDAWRYFSIAERNGSLPSRLNLAHVAFIRKEYGPALAYYRSVLERDPSDPAATLGVARCSYELDRFSEAAAAYERLRGLDPGLYGRYTYLASVFGGEGRAWSLSERADSVEWAERVAVAVPPETAPATEAPPVAAVDEVVLPVAAQPPASGSAEIVANPDTVPAAKPEPARVAVAAPHESAPVPLPSPVAAASELLVAAPIPAPKRANIAAAPEPSPARAAVPVIPPKNVVEKEHTPAVSVVEVKPPVAPSPPVQEKVEDAAVPAPMKTAAISEPVLRKPAPPTELLRGFSTFKAGPGRWVIGSDEAVQRDPLQMYAKIAATLPASKGPVLVEFKTRATGYGWTGFGLHLHAEGVRTLEGYGAGRSLLVWFTSDPRSYPEAPERVQLYLSLSDTDIRLIADEALPLSIREKRSYAVSCDPRTGEIRVAVDGEDRLVRTVDDCPEGDGVLFRALDTAEFSELRITAVDRLSGGARE